MPQHNPVTFLQLHLPQYDHIGKASPSLQLNISVLNDQTSSSSSPRSCDEYNNIDNILKNKLNLENLNDEFD